MNTSKPYPNQPLPQSQAAFGWLLSPPTHWVSLRLDEQATLYVKDLDIPNREITYKVLARNNQVLEVQTRSPWEIEGEEVLLRSIRLPWSEFKRVIDILCPD